jgi:uncharacterized protein (DUF2062 family)
MKLKRIKNFFSKFFLINDSPHKIAAGAALGLFMGTVPGEGVIATLVVASIFRFNRLSATIGVLVFNMWMTLIVAPIAAIVGGFLFQVNYLNIVSDFNRTYSLGWKYFLDDFFLLKIALPLMVGFIISAGIISFGFYLILLYLLKKRKIKL